MQSPMNTTFREMTHPFQTVTVPSTGNPVSRAYLVQYDAVTTVDNEGQQCDNCAIKGAVITCNIYVYDMDGNPQGADTCDECVLPVLDDGLDTDPDRLILVERIDTRTQLAKGYRS